MKRLFPFLVPILIYLLIFIIHKIMLLQQCGASKLCLPFLWMLLLCYVLPVSAIMFFIIDFVKYINHKNPAKLFGAIIHGLVIVVLFTIYFLS